MRPLKLLIPFIYGLLILTGCSDGATEPVGVPGIPLVKGVESPPVENASQRVLWGVWNITFDPVNYKVNVEPVRNAGAHFDVTGMITPPACDDCIEITVNSFDPVTRILDADVTLRNPYAISGYDVRGILYTNDYGHLLKNPDDWTKLFETPGGESLNPFKAFAKNWTNRKFAASLEHTENYLIYIPQPPNYWAITFAVTASWPGNSKEPYAIWNYSHGVIYDNSGSYGMVVVAVRDWQNDVDYVTLEAPEITGENVTQLVHLTDKKWYAWVVNNAGASAEEYSVKLTARSSNSGDVALYDFKDITITEGPPAGWARTWGGDGPDYGIDAFMDDNGNIYITGVYVGTADFDPGPGEDLHTGQNGDYDAFLSKLDSSGNLIWARTWGSPDDDEGTGIAIDDNGDIYVVGYFSGTVDFDPGSGVDEHTTEGYRDNYISKFDESGDFQWVRIWGGAPYYVNLAVATDTFGDVYIVGEFSGTADFDPGSGVEERTSNGDTDVFLSKLDSSGVFHWVTTWGGAGWDAGDDIAISEAGDIYATGTFTGNVDFDPGVNVDEHISDGDWGAFLCKYNQSGDYDWALTWGADGSCEGCSNVVDSLGSVYVTGCFAGAGDFDPSPGVDEHSSDGSYDNFISKFSSTGDFQWTRTWGGPGIEYTSDVVVDNYGYAYVSGCFMSTVDFDPGAGVDEHTSSDYLDSFLSKFDTSGDFIWARTWGGVFRDSANEIVIDNVGNCYVVGDYHGPSDFDPGPGVDMRTAYGFQDIFLSKFPPDGDW